MDSWLLARYGNKIRVLALKLKHTCMSWYYLFLSVHSILFWQRLPIYWSWYYWGNPVAWSLYGLLVSQYGDVDAQVKLAGGAQTMAIKQLLKEQFGYRHDLLGPAAIAVVSFCLLFALTFAFAIKTLNFQTRWWRNLRSKQKRQVLSMNHGIYKELCMQPCMHAVNC